ANAILPAVETAVQALASTNIVGGNVTTARLAGLTRYDTMQILNTDDPATSDGVYAGLPTAIVATGEDFADALSASGLAFARHFPVILTTGSTFSPQALASP